MGTPFFLFIKEVFIISIFDNYSKTYKTGTGKDAKYVQSSNLPAHYSNINVAPPTVIQNAKQKILLDFATVFNISTKTASGYSSQLRTLTLKEINQMLQMWTTGDSGGELGQALGDAITQKLQDDPWTGAGMTKGLENGLNMDSPMRASNNLAKQALTEAETLWKRVEEMLQRYIKIYDELGEDALLAKCVEIYRTAGKKADSQFLAKYNGISLSTAKQAELSSKVDGLFNDLQKNLENLFSLIDAKGVGNKAATKQSPYQLGKSLGSGFNSLGGETIGEIVGLTGAANVRKEAKDKLLDKLVTLFETSGGVVTVDARQTGEDTIEIGGENKQGKGDWSIFVSFNGVTIQIPVSQKLRQSKGNSNVRGVATGGLPNKVEVQSLSLQSLMAMTFQGGPEWIEQHLAVLSSSDNNIIDIKNSDGVLNEAVNLWNDFKEAAKYMGLFRALVGTGGKLSSGGLDFAALFIVNNQIFSIGDILLKAVAEETGNVFFMSPAEIISFSEMREKVSGPYYNEENVFNIHKDDGGKATRLSEQYAAIRALYQKKYTFQINLALLTGKM